MSTKELRERGLTIGENTHIYTDQIDFGHGYLISIGSNTTLASAVRLICHDASTKKILGLSKVGRIDIGDDVFIGAASIVLPNVKIGNKVVIGAGSVVVNDIPSGSVAVGNPCKVVGKYEDFVKKNTELFEHCPKQYSETTQKSCDEKNEMKEQLRQTGWGFDN